MSGFGAFGKMPALGDFFRLGLPADFVTPWDQWIQAGMLAGRTALAERWDACFLSAPIWRFTLAASLCGPDAVEGVMMASVDRVGRQFPLTLARALPAGTDPVAHHLGEAAAASFEALEAVALDALDEATTRDRLAERLAALPQPAPEPAPPVGHRGGLIIVDGPGLPAAGLAAALAGRAYGRAAVFTALMGSGQRLILGEGLPAPAAMTAFYDPAPEVTA